MGISQDHPATALREAITVIRGLLAGESVDFHGKVIQLNDRSLDFQPDAPVPILIGTGFGHAIQELAGEVADAVMLANYASPGPIQSAFERVLVGARRAGRSPKDFRVISRIDVAIHADPAQAKAAVSPAILSAMRASYPALTYLEDLPEFELSSRLLNVLKRKDYQTRAYYAAPFRSAEVIPSALIEHFSVAGTPAEVTNRLLSLAQLKIFDEIAIHLIPCEGQTYINALNELQRVIEVFHAASS
jgi:5,10-methylenetetrahydromethanopterin reductase